MDTYGNQAINFIDEDNPKQAAQMICEWLKHAAEGDGKNLAPDRDAAEYYAITGMEAYALWVDKPGNEEYKKRFIKAIEDGVYLYLQSGHPERMKIIEEISSGQRKLREIIGDNFGDVVDEYEIEGQRIDIYLPGLNLGIEFDGRQHYEFCPVFHKTEADFKRQQWLDREKERKCRERGISLVRVRHDEEISMKTILAKIMESRQPA